MRSATLMYRRAARLASLAALALLVAACAGTRSGSGGGSGSGGYYMDDGPGNNEPADIASIADAVPSDEPVRAVNSRPYEVFGQRYVPMRARTPYRERGIASWYGRKFHGNATASGERYDMYAMTAAHRTLPLPSYVRVTNLSNQRSVVVRVNDRGPFVKNRLIDLSWTAAKKLGFIDRGHTNVLVELVLPGEGPAAQEETFAAAPREAPPSPAAVAPPGASVSRGLVLVGATPGSPGEPSPPEPDAGSSASSGFVRADAEAPVGAVRPEPQAGGFVRVDAEASRGGFVPVDDAAPAVAPAASGLYLQLGAFQSHGSAMAIVSDLGRRLHWLGDALSMHAENGQYKVQAGPWADSAQAEQAAARIRAETRMQPFTVRREAAR